MGVLLRWPEMPEIARKSSLAATDFGTAVRDYYG